MGGIHLCISDTGHTDCRGEVKCHKEIKKGHRWGSGSTGLVLSSPPPMYVPPSRSPGSAPELHEAAGHG